MYMYHKDLVIPIEDVNMYSGLENSGTATMAVIVSLTYMYNVHVTKP